MAARTQGVGRGVRWDAFGNIANLLARAGQAKGEGYASLGAGIGGGISALGANRRQDKRDADLLAERQEERAYRRGRDETQDRQWQASFDLNKSNVEADNARQDSAARAARLNGPAAAAIQALQIQQDAQKIQQAEKASQAARLGGIIEKNLSIFKAISETQGEDSPAAAKAMADAQHAMQAYSALGGDQLNLGHEVGGALSLGGPLGSEPQAPPQAAPQPSIGGPPAREMGGAPARVGAASSAGPRVTIPGVGLEVGMGDLAPEARDASQRMLASLNMLKQARDEASEYDRVAATLAETREAKLKEAAAANEALKKYDGKSAKKKAALAFDAQRKEVVATATVTATARLESMVGHAKGLAAQRRQKQEADKEAAKAAEKAQRDQAEGAALVRRAPGFGDLPPERQQAILSSPDPKWAYTQEQAAAKEADRLETDLKRQGWNLKKSKRVDDVIFEFQAQRMENPNKSIAWADDLDPESLAYAVLHAGIDGPMLENFRQSVERRAGGKLEAAKMLVNALPAGVPKKEKHAALDRIMAVFGLPQPPPYSGGE